MKILTYSLLLLIPLTYGRLVFDSDKKLVHINDRVKLDCINTLKNNTILINFNSELVCNFDPIFSQITNKDSSRFGVTTTINDSSSVLHLTILHFSNSDIGQYVCRDTITNAEQSISLDKPVKITRVTMTPTNNPLLVIGNRTRPVQCETDVGRPAATLRWFKGGTDISSQATISTMNNITTSVLQLTPRTTDQGRFLFCTADNGGDVRTSTKASLDVLYGPTAPTCTYAGSLVTDPLYVREDQVFTLNCSSSGNPAPGINWTLSDMVTSNSLTLVGISRLNDGAITIRAGNVLQPSGLTAVQMSNTATVTVTVYYPPDPIRCSLGSESSLTSGALRVVGGSNFTIDCSTSSNPAPGYTWTWPGGNYGDHQLSVNNIQTEGPFTITAQNFMSFSNQSSETGSVLTSFSVLLLYPPQNPTFHYGGTNGSLISGDTLYVLSGNTTIVACISSARPEPSYSSWNGAGQLWTFIANVDTSRKCEVSNTLNPTGFNVQPRLASDTLNFKVLYPPTKPNFHIRTCRGDAVEVTSSVKVMKGHSVHITCTTSSYPTSTYRWSSQQTEQNNVMSIPEADISHQKLYTCFVENTMMPTFGDPVPGENSRTTNITILYPPSVSTINNITVLEGLNTSANCRFIPGNPMETQIKWTRSNNAHVISTSQTLLLIAISRPQAGLYRCTALNVMEPTGCNTTVGSSHFDLFVDVHYGASITDFTITEFEGTDVVILNENSRVPLYCGVDSNPGSQIVILKDGLHLKQANNAQSLTLFIEQSKCEDDSVYMCTARNIHDSVPVDRKLTVFVRCSPRAHSELLPVLNVTSASNDSATLTFNLVAYPRPNISDFVWEKQDASGNGWKVLYSTDNVNISVAANRLQTSLSIHAVKEWNFGTYRVNVSNELGNTAQYFLLRAKEKPHPPFSLQQSGKALETSISVEWKPGFDGGLPQTFYIQYKVSSDTTWTDEKVDSVNNTHTVTNLKPGTTYTLRVFAENDKGQSSKSEAVTVTTLSKIEGPKLAPIISGSIGGSVGLCILVLVPLLLVKLRKKANVKEDGKELTKTHKMHSLPKDDGEDEEVINPIYEGSDDIEGINSQADNLCSKPCKKYGNVDSNASKDVYAVVQKKIGKRATTKTKSNHKEDIYENCEEKKDQTNTGPGFDRFKNHVSANGEMPKKNANQDGLIYADLEFAKPPKGQKRLVIHGLDDMTEYAEVDLSKKANPLPDSDDDGK